MKQFVIKNRGVSIFFNIKFWNFYWGVTKFNSGNPYTGYHLGPLRVDIFKGKYIGY